MAWELVVTVDGRRKVLWSGDNLTPLVLVSLLTRDISAHNIQEIVLQIILNCPSKSLNMLFTCLVCTYWRYSYVTGTDSSMDVILRAFHGIVTSKSLIPGCSHVCGVVFKKGEIVWTCRECGKNSTCVLCDKCYKNSNHVGHEVYFHVAAGNGGCCDCGDEEAWLKEGCCPKHYPKNDDNIDPTSYLSPDLLRGLHAVISELIKVITIYAVGCVKGFNKKSDNIYANRLENELRDTNLDTPIALIGRLHNDDVHSYDDVINALREFFPHKSENEFIQMTTNVDKEGDSLIFTTASMDKNTVSRTLVAADSILGIKAGLLLSVVPQDLYLLDSKIATILAWFKTLGSSNDALRRVITNLLFTDIEELCDATTTTTATYLPIFKMLLPIFSSHNKNQFPNCIPQVLRWMNSESFPDVYIYPFDLCHRNPFAVMMMGSPYLSKSVAKVINDIVVLYQHDRIFKYCFSQNLTILYPAIQVLFNRGIGEEQRTLLGTTVQVYTADSIVNCMSSEGVNSRLLPEFDKPMHVSSVYIAKMMTSTVKFILKDMGCHRSRINDDFLKDRFISHRYKRLWQVLNDFKYICEDTLSTLKVLCNERDPGVVDDLLQMLTCCQYLDKYNRRSGTHVEFESAIWLPAAELVLKVYEIGSSLLSNSFFPANISCKSTTSDTSSLLGKKRTEAINVIVSSTLLKLTEWSGSLVEDNGMLYFNNNNQIITCLGVPVIFHGIRRFHVSFSAVSIHIPLQRFLTQSIIAAANSGTSLLYVLSELFSNPEFNFSCYIDYSIRCLSFSSQITVGMWRRNGQLMDTLNHNYSHHLCRKFKDVDIHSVQFGIFSIGYDSTLAMFVDRFELTAMFEISDYFLSTDVLKEYKEPLLGLMLQVIIHMTTYLPEKLVNDSGSDDIGPDDIGPGLRELLHREIAHKLIGGVNQISILENMKGSLLDGGKDVISDAIFQSVIDELSSKRSLNDSDKYVLEIKPHILSYYYPEFPHLSGNQHSVAIEAVRKEKERLLDASAIVNTNAPSNITELTKCSSPLFATLAVPQATVHPDFLQARGILFSPLMLEIINHCIRLCITRKGDKNSFYFTILGRIVHIIQLQVYTFPDYVTLLGSQDLLGRLHALFPLMDKNASCKFDDYAASYLLKQQNFIDILADLFASNVLVSENLYKYGFYWLVKEFYSNNHVVQSAFHRKNIMLDNNHVSQGGGIADADNNKKRAADARSRALNSMAKMSMKFMEMVESSDEEAGMTKTSSIDDSNVGNESKAARVSNSLEDGCSECIICHMRTGEAIGYLSYVQSSANIRNSIKKSMKSSCPLLYQVYRVVALSGCDVYSQPSNKVLSIINNDSDSVSKPIFRPTNRMISHLSQGDHITSDRRVLNWISINHPVSGWCKIYESDTTVLLYPIHDLQFNKHGKSRVHASKCSHAIHFSCWEKYSTSYRSGTQLNRWISDCVDTASNEILCPLCKGISNCLIPHYPPQIGNELLLPFVHVVRPNRTLEVDDTAKFINLVSGEFAPTDKNSVHDTSAIRPIELCLTVALIKRYDYKWTKEKSQKMGLVIRDIHYLWSTISYTMLTTVTNYRWLKTSFRETYDRDDGNIQLIRSLLVTARNVVSWFPNEHLYHDEISIPLQSLLHGGSIFPSHNAMESGFKLLDAHGINIDQCYRLLFSLPFSSAETQPYSNNKISLILQLCKQKGVDIQRLWGILRIPILSQDLHVISVACFSAIPDASNLDSIFSIMVIARMAQILIEPASLGYSKYNSDECIGKDDELSTELKTVLVKLLDCRDLLCGSAKVPHVTSYPTEAEGVTYLVGVVMSLIPFLEYLCSFYYVILLGNCEGNKEWISSFERTITNFNNIDGVMDSSGVIGHVDLLLSLLNLPKLQELLCYSLIPIAMSSWGEQFSRAHSYSDSVSNINQGHPWIPGSIETKGEVLVSTSVTSDNGGDLPSGIEATAAVSMNTGLHLNPSSEIENESNYDSSDDNVDDNGDDNEDDNGDDNMDAIEDDNMDAIEDGDLIPNGILTGDNDILDDLMEQFLAADMDPEALDADFLELLPTRSWNLYGIDPPIYSTIDEPLTASEPNRLISVHSDTPLQGTISGVGRKMNGYNGEELQYTFNDLSHYGLSLPNTPGMIDLPLNYTDLYDMVKGDNILPDSPALCLLCGKVVHAANRKREYSRRQMTVNDPGECTLHSRDCGVGVGIFFLLKQCKVLLIRDNHSVLLPSIYLDSRGEAGESRGHIRPLFLSTRRYQRLKDLYLKHLVGREVARLRSSGEGMIIAPGFY